MSTQLEAIPKQGTQHRSDLIQSRILTGCARLYIEPLCKNPLRQTGLNILHLVPRGVVGEVNVQSQGEVGRREKPASRRIRRARTEWNVGVESVVRPVR